MGVLKEVKRTNMKGYPIRTRKNAASRYKRILFTISIDRFLFL